SFACSFSPHVVARLSPTFFFYCHAHYPDLHSFPTRRSSDLRSRSKLPGYFSDALKVCRKRQRKVEILCEGESVPVPVQALDNVRSEEHTSELQSRFDLVCRLLLEKKKNISIQIYTYLAIKLY